MFCCTFSCAATPALAQQSQTYTLNGLQAVVIAPTVPVRLGDTFWISVEMRPRSRKTGGGNEGTIEGEHLLSLISSRRSQAASLVDALRLS
jgi:hypothetical protein